MEAIDASDGVPGRLLMGFETRRQDWIAYQPLNEHGLHRKRLVLDAFSAATDLVTILASAGEGFWIHATTQNAVTQIRNEANNIVPVKANSLHLSLPPFARALHSLAKVQAGGNTSISSKFVDSLERLVLDADRLRIIAAETEAEAAAARALEAAHNAELAAGMAGEATLALHFHEFAKREERRALIRRFIMVIFVIGGSIVSGTIVLRTEDPADLILSVEIVLKLIVALPLLALGYYFGHEARRHDDASMRAREIEVRMRTLGAYTSDLGDDTKASVRALFGAFVFGSLSQSDGQSTGGPKESGEGAPALALLFESLLARPKGN